MHSLLVTCISPHEAVVYTVRIRRAWNVSSGTHYTLQAINQTPHYRSQTAADTFTRLGHQLPPTSNTTTHPKTRYKSNQIYHLEEPSSYPTFLSPLLHDHQHVFPPPHFYSCPPEAFHHLNTCSWRHLHGRCCCSTDDIHPWCQCRPKARKGSKMVSFALLLILSSTDKN